MSAAAIVDRALEWPVVTSYTRMGCAVRRRVAHWRALETYDLRGRVALVTGATSGIGFAAAEAIGRMGAHVIVLGRDAERTEAAAANLERRTPGGEFSSVLAAMDDAEAVRQAAAEVASRHARLDVLVHNAGALAPHYRRSPMGVEETGAAQVAGQYLLTALLLDRLEAARPGRVLTVSSGGAYLSPLTVRGLDPPPADFDGGRQYTRAKRAQITLNELWGERMAGRDIVFHALHPGWADTRGLADSLPRFRTVLRPLLRSAEEAADTIAFLSADEAALVHNGAFWFDRVRRPAHHLGRTRRADTPERRSRLWAWCESTSGFRIVAAGETES